VVTAFADLLRVRQKLVQMAAPARRIGAVLVDMAERPGGVEALGEG